MHIKAILRNAAHPEYGQISIPFPIPDNQYDEIIGMLEQMEIGNAVRRDCRVDEIKGDIPVLKRLENSSINIDELDYLAKRLDSFTGHEMAQFQSVAAQNGYSDMTDFINLTFSCQEATVITNFSDLERIGKNHMMTVNGGMSKDEFEQTDFRFEAMKLILNEKGTITPYGVVYDNGMQLTREYDGRHFPEYRYRYCVLEMEMTLAGVDDLSNAAYLDLPMPQSRIDRVIKRLGAPSEDHVEHRFMESELPEGLDALLDMENESLADLNQMCAGVALLDSGDMRKLGAVVRFGQPDTATQVCRLLRHLDEFDVIPGISTAEDYGRYMIRESGRYDYDENLDELYDYVGYGQQRMDHENGVVTDYGYICYNGVGSIDEIMNGASPVQSWEKGGME